MDEDISKEIERLKEDLARKKEEAADIRTLVNQEIDRPFPANIEEFSERELETYIAESIAAIKTQIDARPDRQPFASHRKIVGRLISSFKRFLLQSMADYNDAFLAKQVGFNERSVNLYHAVLLRIKHNKERMKQIQEKIGGFEEALAVFEARLADIRSRLDRAREGKSTQDHEPKQS
jgi:cell division septum initiation protein DivIVA